MKLPQFIVTVILSLVALILVINLIFMGNNNQKLQANLQQEQQEINRGSMSQQIGTKMLQDIAQASLKDEALKDVLAKSGYSVNYTPAASPAPAATGTK